MRFIFAIALLGLSLSGCFQAHSDESLSSVPVTNNPHIIPSSSQTAQVPSFGN